MRISIFFLSLLTAIPLLAGNSSVRFNRDIRPLMSDTCFHCHGPDKNSRKAGLRLDIREEALKPAKSGALPIVPGKPDESEIIKRIFTDDKDDLMPPEEAHKTFTPAQKELFKRWVAEGAAYEPHWAYTSLTQPPVPKISSDKFQSSNPIDAFIAEKLIEKNITTPSQPADARTLIRRLSLDLTGLPPTPAETEAFVADSSRNPEAAYAALVDRLLNSPRYGERMAVWWLDVARFTDTVGFHGDQNQRVFPYRDYVISAFNKNKPFNQFTMEQVAGDLLPSPTTEQLVASGFNRLNMMTREGGAQPKEYLAKYGAERVRTIGGAFLGATLGCCECHDHKFDPFTSRDFYAMQAFFADVKQWGVYADYNYTKNPDLKGFDNEHPFPPEIEVSSPYLLERTGRIRSAMRSIAKSALVNDVKARPDFAAWSQAGAAFFKTYPSGWITPMPTVKLSAATPVTGKGKPKKEPKAAANAPKKSATADVGAFVVESDGKIFFKDNPADNTTVSMRPPAGWVSMLRVELLPDSRHKGGILRSGAQGVKLKLGASVIKAGSAKEQAIAFRHADANHKQARYNDGEEVIGVRDAWAISAEYLNEVHTAVCLLDKPVKMADGDIINLKITGNNAGCVRVSLSPFAVTNLRDAAPELAELKSALEKTKADDELLADSFLASTGWNEAAFNERAAQYAKLLECRNGKAWTLVTQAVPQPLTVRVLPRGNFMDESGPVVQPASPEFLPAVFRPVEGKRLTRLELAKWLCSKENPLTPRAVMNRLWKQFFGNGLSLVVDDLGAQGEPPSHPELLDWIAAEFRDCGWDVKHMIRLFVTSKTYRQSSSLRPELKDVDPNNRLLASQNPRRLDAEFVRDNALFVAGLLNMDIGGPSVKPYQPAGYYANLQFPNRDYVADNDDRQWRRGLYMHWQRTFLHPMLANFDAPMRDECTASRPPSNTPQQALTLLNDPTFVEAARVFAKRILDENAGSDEKRIARAFEIALARPVQDNEKASLLGFLKTQRESFKADTAAAGKILHVGIAPSATSADIAELAAWTSLCRVILNLQETITRY